MLQILCALDCEAKPLVHYFKLKIDTDCRYFRLYFGKDIRLIVSGVGRVNAAAATSFLMTTAPKDQTLAWLNVGIGGHKQRSVGEGFLGNTITDCVTGMRYYPGITRAPPLPTLPIETLEPSSQKYPDEAIVDMEASAFFATASRRSPSDVIQVYKCISDNEKTPACNLNKGFVSDLIGSKKKEIVAVVEALERLRNELGRQHPNIEMEYFLQNIHFTTTQRIQLERLARRWKAINVKDRFFDSQAQALKDPKKLLIYLENKIQTESLTF